MNRWDFFSLKLFAEVVELRSIGRAAERNHIAASAASKRIADLEATFNTPLLYRLPRGVEPTPAGYALYHHAKNTLRGLQQLEAELGEFAQGIKGHLRVYANLTAVVQFLPEDLERFRAANPDVKIDLQEHSTTAVINAVMGGTADVGIIAPVEAYPPDLQSWQYRNVRLVLVTPRDHPLGQQKSAAFDQALAYDFVGLSAGGGWDKLMVRSAAAYNSTIRINVRMRSYDAVCRLVQANLGISVMPSEIAQLYGKTLGLKVVKLDEPWTELSLDVCARDYKALSAPGRLFIDHLLGRKALDPAV
jgi:DNA-binding transcriptional LysR family regulator